MRSMILHSFWLMTVNYFSVSLNKRKWNWSRDMYSLPFRFLLYMVIIAGIFLWKLLGPLWFPWPQVRAAGAPGMLHWWTTTFCELCIPLYQPQFEMGVCNQLTHAMGQGSICITNSAALTLMVPFLLHAFKAPWVFCWLSVPGWKGAD